MKTSGNLTPADALDPRELRLDLSASVVYYTTKSNILITVKYHFDQILDGSNIWTTFYAGTIEAYGQASFPGFRTVTGSQTLSYGSSQAHRWRVVIDSVSVSANNATLLNLAGSAEVRGCVSKRCPQPELGWLNQSIAGPYPFMMWGIGSATLALQDHAWTGFSVTSQPGTASGGSYQVTLHVVPIVTTSFYGPGLRLPAQDFVLSSNDIGALDASGRVKEFIRSVSMTPTVIHAFTYEIQSVDIVTAPGTSILGLAWTRAGYSLCGDMPTATPSSTPTISLTRTPSSTRTGTRTPSASATRTASPSPSVTRTPSVSASPSPTASPSGTPTRSATPSPSNSPTLCPSIDYAAPANGALHSQPSVADGDLATGARIDALAPGTLIDNIDLGGPRRPDFAGLELSIHVTNSAVPGGAAPSITGSVRVEAAFSAGGPWFFVGGLNYSVQGSVLALNASQDLQRSLLASMASVASPYYRLVQGGFGASAGFSVQVQVDELHLTACQPTPTPTSTASPSPSASPSWTASPSGTLSVSATATPTATESASETATPTPACAAYQPAGIWPSEFVQYAVSVPSDGSLWVHTGFGPTRLQHYASDGTLLEDRFFTAGYFGTTAMVVDTDGSLLFVQGWDLYRATTGGPVLIQRNLFNGIYTLTMAPDGSLYAVEDGYRYRHFARYAYNGWSADQTVPLSGVTFARSLALMPTGDILIPVRGGSANSLRRYDASGALRAVYPLSYQVAGAVALDPAGRALLHEVNASAVVGDIRSLIHTLDPWTGVEISASDNPLTGMNAVPAEMLLSPTDSGRIFTWEPVTKWIWVFDPCANSIPTRTASRTISPSPSVSPTPTLSATGTPSVTESATPSVTETMTETTSPTATETATDSATPSATETASESATPSATATVSETATPSATETATETGSPSATATVTQSASASASPSASATPTPTSSATLTESPSRTVTASATQTRSATPTSTITPVPCAQCSATSVVYLFGGGSLGSTLGSASPMLWQGTPSAPVVLPVATPSGFPFSLGGLTGFRLGSALDVAASGTQAEASVSFFLQGYNGAGKVAWDGVIYDWAEGQRRVRLEALAAAGQVRLSYSSPSGTKVWTAPGTPLNQGSASDRGAAGPALASMSRFNVTPRSCGLDLSLNGSLAPAAAQYSFADFGPDPALPSARYLYLGNAGDNSAGFDGVITGVQIQGCAVPPVGTPTPTLSFSATPTQSPTFSASPSRTPSGTITPTFTPDSCPACAAGRGGQYRFDQANLAAAPGSSLGALSWSPASPTYQGPAGQKLISGFDGANASLDLLASGVDPHAVLLQAFFAPYTGVNNAAMVLVDWSEGGRWAQLRAFSPGHANYGRVELLYSGPAGTQSLLSGPGLYSAISAAQGNGGSLLSLTNSAVLSFSVRDCGLRVGLLPLSAPGAIQVLAADDLSAGAAAPSYFKLGNAVGGGQGWHGAIDDAALGECAPLSSPTPSLTPTEALSATATASPSPTETERIPPTLSFTETATPSATPTLTPSVSPTPTPAACDGFAGFCLPTQVQRDWPVAPSAVIFDALPYQGGLVVVDASSSQRRLYRLDGAGTQLWTLSAWAGGAFSGPRHVDLGADGLLYVSDASTSLLVVVDPADGHWVRSVPMTPPSRVFWFGPAEFYVAGRSGGLWAFDPSGASLAQRWEWISTLSSANGVDYDPCTDSFLVLSSQAGGGAARVRRSDGSVLANYASADLGLGAAFSMQIAHGVAAVTEFTLQKLAFYRVDALDAGVSSRLAELSLGYIPRGVRWMPDGSVLVTSTGIIREYACPATVQGARLALKGGGAASGPASLLIAPNPFVGAGLLRVSLPRAARARVSISDLAGTRVWAQDLGTLPAGVQDLGLDLRDKANGIYLAVLETDEGEGWHTAARFKLALAR